jgi:hypothetical protein
VDCLDNRWPARCSPEGVALLHRLSSRSESEGVDARARSTRTCRSGPARSNGQCLGRFLLDGSGQVPSLV